MALSRFARRASSGQVAMMFMLASFCARSAAADEGSDDLAQQLFNTGVDAARQNDWFDARQSFERAYRLAPKLVVLINLAGAQARTGLLVDAHRNYQRVLETSLSPDTAEYRNAAKAILPSLEARIPRIRVTLSGLSAADVVAIDGEPVARSALQVPYLVDPGAHTLAIKRDGALRARIDFSVAEGESHDISLPAAVFAPLPEQVSRGTDVTLTQTEGSSHPQNGRHWWKAGWFWAATAGLVAAATVAVVLVAQRPQPYSGNIGPGIVNVP